MGHYVIRRLLWGLFTVWVISLVVFSIFFVLPSGDPAVRIAGKNPTPEQIEQIREQWHFNESKPSQYFYLMGQLVSGDLKSYSSGLAVVPEIFKSIPVTISLIMFAAVIWLTIGVGFGVKAASAEGTATDRILIVAALAGVSIPVAWIALLALMMFTDKIPLFPAGGYMPISEGGLIGWAHHMLLPACTLSIVLAGTYAVMTRTNVKSAMREEYIKTAVAKGLTERRVFTRHVLRTGLIPILVLIGLDIGALMGGAVFTETIFGLPGMGSLLFSGINQLDYPILIACTMFAATFVVLANLGVDLVQAAVDPRIRLD